MRDIQDRGGIEELARDIEVTTHNMWVDVRSEDIETGEYDSVQIEAVVRVSEK